MNDFTLINATRQFAEEDRARSWFHLLSTGLLSFSCFAGILFFPEFRWLQFALSVLLSLLFLRTFMLYHDYQHHAIFQKDPSAGWMLNLFGCLVLTAPSIWKRSHDFHHQHNSKIATTSIGSFPVMRKSDFIGASPAMRHIYLASRHPLTVLMGYLTMFMFGMCIRPMLKKFSWHYDCLAALVLHVLLYAVLIWWAGVYTTLFALFIPLFLSSGAGAYLFYVQHNFPGVVMCEDQQWSYTDAALLSTCYIRMPAPMRWFTGNIGYHHIHHLNHKIPFYRLPEAHELEALQNVKTISLSLRDAIACFRLKVWDEEQQKMLTLAEVRKEMHSGAVPAI